MYASLLYCVYVSGKLLDHLLNVYFHCYFSGASKPCNGKKEENSLSSLENDQEKEKAGAKFSLEFCLSFYNQTVLE